MSLTTAMRLTRLTATELGAHAERLGYQWLLKSGRVRVQTDFVEHLLNREISASEYMAADLVQERRREQWRRYNARRPKKVA